MQKRSSTSSSFGTKRRIKVGHVRELMDFLSLSLRASWTTKADWSPWQADFLEGDGYLHQADKGLANPGPGRFASLWQRCLVCNVPGVHWASVQNFEDSGDRSTQRTWTSEQYSFRLRRNPEAHKVFPHFLTTVSLRHHACMQNHKSAKNVTSSSRTSRRTVRLTSLGLLLRNQGVPSIATP